jgi:hypothetical protein
LLTVLKGGEPVTVLGGVNSTFIVNPTACAVGRGTGKGSVFCTTGEGQVFELDGDC